MALTTRRYGRYTTAAEADYGTMSAGNLRASVYDASDYDIWVVSGAMWSGKSSATNATMRIAAYEVSGNAIATTSDRLAYTDAITVNTSMSGGSGGAAFSGDFTAPWQLHQGTQYGGGALVTTAGIEHSMRQASAITADNELFYQRTGLSQPPPDPFGAFTSSTEGHLSLWFEGYENEAPLASTNRSPSGTITDTAPTFEGDFNDRNGVYGTTSASGVDTGDSLNQYQIQLRATGTTTLLWNTTYTATSAERAADAMSRAYGGSTLTRGTSYEWRVRMSDDFAAWGDWSSWLTFTPSSLGVVTLDSTPTGKTEDDTPDFAGKWNHNTALSTNAVQIKLRDGNTGATLQTSGVIAKVVASSAAPGTAFTITWADSGFTALAWGRSFTYSIRGRDSGNNWSDWSDERTFNTNATPTTPTGLSPRNSQVVSTYPLLTCTFTDSDDTTATGLTGTALIIRPDLSTTTVTLTYNVTTAKWEYQTTGVELTAYGTYYWSARSYDGTVYSGGTTVVGDADYSDVASFVYAAGPDVAITNIADGDTVATASKLVEWSSVGGYTDWEVIVYDAGTTTVVYRSGVVSEGATTYTGSHTIPSGYYLNGSSYDIVIEVTDALLLNGASVPITINISYTAATVIANVQATAFKIGTDLNESAIRISWDATAYTTPEFQEYIVTRTASGGVDAAQIILARISTPSATGLVDYFPASGYDYTYAVSVVILTGLDELQSTPVEATASIALEETVLALVTDPAGSRAILANVTDRSDESQNERATYVPLSGSKPTTVRSASRFKTMPITAKIVGDANATAVQRRDDLDTLDAALGTVCIRYADGTKRFADMQSLKVTYEHGGYFTATFTALEQEITEGTV